MGEFLEGKKTYIVAIVLGLTVAAQSLGWIDDTTATMIEGLLVSTGLMTMRAGIAKKSLVLLAGLGLAGMLATATPAVADDVPAFGCGGDGCSIYLVTYEWPASGGVNALEFLQLSGGVGATGLEGHGSIGFLGGLCLIPKLNSIPFCPSSESEPENVLANR